MKILRELLETSDFLIMKDGFSVGNIRELFFAISGFKFQLLTICKRLTALFIEPGF
jgi:hypothetical protein